MFDAKYVRIMRKKSIYRSLAAAVLGLLGFASCEKAGEEPMLQMYGMPYAQFKAMGSVTSESGKPVEGIRVAIRQSIREYSEYEDDTVYTDSKGMYLLEKGLYKGPDSVSIVFEDVDGPENGGEFEPAAAKPEVVQTKKESGMYGGSFEAKADVVMKEK